ncbi:hypothetical protein GCM10010446_32360 [Streptomyces enissocaesilis]|uniref:Uncharacterized protein n=1 Tax=Streptomyces enissocaesilis TaxID=332589 RepID=A0ABP6JSR7_9ACTN
MAGQQLAQLHRGPLGGYGGDRPARGGVTAAGRKKKERKKEKGRQEKQGRLRAPREAVVEKAGPGTGGQRPGSAGAGDR